MLLSSQTAIPKPGSSAASSPALAELLSCPSREGVLVISLLPPRLVLRWECIRLVSGSPLKGENARGTSHLADADFPFASPFAPFSAPFLGPVGGPIISGFINQHLDWRWTWWVTIMCVASTPSSPPTPRPALTFPHLTAGPPSSSSSSSSSFPKLTSPPNCSPKPRS